MGRRGKGRTWQLGWHLHLGVHHLGDRQRRLVGLFGTGAHRQILGRVGNRRRLDLSGLAAQPRRDAVSGRVLGTGLARGAAAQDPAAPVEEEQHGDHGQEDQAEDDAKHRREVRGETATIVVFRSRWGRIRVGVVLHPGRCVWVVGRDSTLR